MNVNTGFSIINLRDGGELRLLFPDEISTEDRTNWEPADVNRNVKPLSFANIEPQKITIDDLTIDYTRANRSVEEEIALLRSWMRIADGKNSPPPLQILTVGWQQRAVLSEMSVKRSFFTKQGVCLRASLNLTFDELPPNARRRVV